MSTRGDKEPKPEVPDVTANQEPVSKRARLSNGLGTSSGSSGSPFGVLEGILEKNRELGEKVENLHKGVLEISNCAINDKHLLDEKIRKMKEEHKEQVSKLKAEQNEWKREILDMREIVLKLTNNSNGGMIHPAQNQEMMETIKNDVNKEKLKTRFLEDRLLELETENLELKKKVIKLEEGIHQFQDTAGKRELGLEEKFDKQNDKIHHTQKNLENLKLELKEKLTKQDDNIHQILEKQDLELKDSDAKAQELFQKLTENTKSEIHEIRKMISKMEDESEKATQTIKESADRKFHWFRGRISTLEKDVKQGCPLNDQSSQREERRTKENGRRLAHGQPSRFNGT